MGGTDVMRARRPGVTGVHSIQRFVLSVPSLDEAERFYRAFGLDVRRTPGALELRTFGNPHCWGVVHGGSPKRLEYVELGMYAEDADAIARGVAQHGAGRAPHRLGPHDGLWLADPDGVALHIVVGPNMSPAAKSPHSTVAPVPPGHGAAPARSKVAQVRPRRLSHILRFSPDVPRMVRFCTEVLGMRLSDRSGDVIAFTHAVHGSDHHVMAFAKSDRPGYHHSSWDVGSVDEVGRGSEQMRNQGYGEGWGVGRHVLGSNYFYYVRDPWKSWAEYSFDIDYVPVDLDWPAADHPGEDSIYVWGPPLHPEFIVNHEAPGSAA
jgi:catechol 2,3-dioxygenase-like lactoylglutathione lyase family enzyme